MNQESDLVVEFFCRVIDRLLDVVDILSFNRQSILR